MKRREFIASSAIALAVASVMPAVLIEQSWRGMTPEELTRLTLRKRQAGIAPNYEETHECPKCSMSYLCPDRYFEPSCGPSDWAAKHGHSSRSMSCSPCGMNVEKYGPAGYRQLWFEAHGIT